MEALIAAVRDYAVRHADSDGLTLTPVPDLRLMFVETPRGDLHSVYRPLVCLVLQGAKRMVVGTQEQVIVAGQSVIVSADMPVAGRIVQADRANPYTAISVEFDVAILKEVAMQLPASDGAAVPFTRTLFAQDTDAAALDCAARLLRLIDTPEAIPVLRPGILRELYFWLLSGRHGTVIHALASPDTYGSRISRAIAELRAEYRHPVRTEHLADIAAMGLSAFHKHFKQMTSLTPGQFQKRLRLIEARRLILNEALTASHAAFNVGYKSVSQFTREYRLLFGASPKSLSVSDAPASMTTTGPALWRDQAVSRRPSNLD